MSLLRRLMSGGDGLRRALNIFGPYWGAGIKVHYITPDYSEAKVSMKLSWYNTNYVGTHFGGSLYSMTDPFYMLMLMNRIGRDYIVWDKAANIDFISPGTGEVTAIFTLTEEMVQDVIHHTEGGEKYLPVWPVDVLDTKGKLVARVQKTLYIKRKQPKPE